MPTTLGSEPGPITRLVHRYFDRLLVVATVDEVVCTAFLRIIHMLDPPAVLFRPGILARAARGPTRPLLHAPPTANRLLDSAAQQA